MMGDVWTTMLFDQAVQVNPSVHLQRGSIYPFVDMQAVDPNSRSVSLSAIREFKGGGSQFRNGDTLMARITPCLENGKIARFAAPDDQPLGHGSTEFIVIRGRPNVTDNGFAYYLTKWDGVRQYCISQMTGSSGRQRVPTSALSHHEVTIPPLKEQQAIACILGSLDDRIELNRRMSRTLEGMARAIFKSWFVDFDIVRAKAAARREHPHWTDSQVGRAACPHLEPEIAALFPDSFQDSELGEIPKGWRVRSVAELADINVRTMGCYDPLDLIDYIEINKVMRGEVSEITRYKSGTEPSRARRRLTHGDTVLSTVRPDRGAYFLCLNPPETLIASTGFAVVTPKADCWAFIHVALTRLTIGEELGRLADGGAYPAIRPEVIGDLQLVVPNGNSLVEVFERISQPFFERVDRGRNEARTLAALRDALLPKLISGELRAPDAEWIAARCV